MINKFLCQCDTDYTGRTIQKVEIGVKQHAPRELVKRSQNTTSIFSQIQILAIGDCFLMTACAKKYSDGNFFVYYKARCKKHLAKLEAIGNPLFHSTYCRVLNFFIYIYIYIYIYICIYIYIYILKFLVKINDFYDKHDDSKIYQNIGGGTI